METSNKKELNDGSKEQLDERLSEATSDATLSDLESAEIDSGSDSGIPDLAPSPDGGFDESAEIKDAGPM